MFDQANEVETEFREYSMNFTLSVVNFLVIRTHDCDNLKCYNEQICF